MLKIKLLTTIAFIAIALFVIARPTHASEGVVELNSTEGQSSRCFVTSVLLGNSNYSLVVSCRDLIYPPAADKFSYVLWAVSPDNRPVKLGELGVGKAEFKTPSAFSILFVTKEVNNAVKSPSEFVALQGTVQSINFLERTPQPTPEVERPTPTPTPQVATGADLGSRIRRAVLTFFIALFGLTIVVIAALLTLRRLRE